MYDDIVDYFVHGIMGGKAFSHGNPPLSTPRMPPKIYNILLNKYLSLLSTFYDQVASPIDVPEKESHGDIDILACGPKSTVSYPVIVAALNAKATVKNGKTRSFAVPYPGSTEDYVQLDLHVCEQSKYQWELFTNSHGDLWNLIGTSIRPFGLTANDVAFYLRIKEIEEVDKKKSLVYLTSDPDVVLNFLGLDSKKYWQPFSTVEDLYIYVTSTRFFRRDSYIREDLKANDRKRLVQRPLFRQFVAEWLPQRPHLGIVEKDFRVMREEVFEEVLTVFGKKEEYTTILEKWRKGRRDLRIKQEGNNLRRAGMIEEIEYADAWIETSKCGLDQAVGSA